MRKENWGGKFYSGGNANQTLSLFSCSQIKFDERQRTQDEPEEEEKKVEETRSTRDSNGDDDGIVCMDKVVIVDDVEFEEKMVCHHIQRESCFNVYRSVMLFHLNCLSQDLWNGLS